MLHFINEQPQKLLRAVSSHFSHINPQKIRGILAQKDIKVNGKRVRENCDLSVGDTVEIFIADSLAYPALDIFYEDENVAVVNKPRKIQVVSDCQADITLDNILNRNFPSRMYHPVHRLDTNTTGLVVFAKSPEVRDLLISAFENDYINKYYLALVSSVQSLKQSKFTDFIRIDKSSGMARLFPTQVDGALTAVLEYEVVESRGDLTLIEVHLCTGRTHQIRAQLAYHKIFVVGDGKYGDKEVNRRYNMRYQCLCAHHLQFKFPKSHPLIYLNSIKFQIPCDF